MWYTLISNLIKEEKYNFFESFTFALTAAVLTLVGLISIYLSINVQHAIQKSRELYWETIGYTYEEQDEKFFKAIRGKIRKNIGLYKHTLNTNKINTFVVIVSIVSILAVLMIWWDYFMYISKMKVDMMQFSKIKFYLIIVTVILVAFCLVLFMITKPYVIGNLKKIENIFDGNKTTELTTVSLAAYSIELLVIVDYGYLQIVPRFPFKLSNIQIKSDVNLYIPEASPYPETKYISSYCWEGEMVIKNDIDAINDLYGYDVNFNNTGDRKDKVYLNQQCTVPNVGGGNGSEINITLYISSYEEKLEVNFPVFKISDIYGTFEYLKPVNVRIPFEIRD